MAEPFSGSAAPAAGALTPYELRSRHIALHQDAYVPLGVELTAVSRAKAAWLRSRRRGILPASRPPPCMGPGGSIPAGDHRHQVREERIELSAERYRGRRGIKTARAAFGLVDGGAQSPKKTWLRLRSRRMRLARGVFGHGPGRQQGGRRV